MKQVLVNTYISILICILVSINSIGQVKTRIYDNGVPSNLLPLKPAIVNELTIKAPTELDNLLQSSKGEVNKPIEYDNRFALPLPVNIDFLASAKEVEDNNVLIYSLTIRAEKALNISTQFKSFKLSPNAVLSIYTKNELTDSITAKENNENNIWATRVYQGNILNFVLRIPKSEIGLSNFTISQISFGYKKYGGEYFGIPGSSAPCNINVLCPQGNGWQNERSAVVFLLVADGTGTCTGSMIMNTCSTNTPYLLTANHCLVGNLNNWVFQYQYWSTTCTPNTGGREDIQFNGCTLRANNATSDFALVQMNQTPPANLGITYAGWNRSTAPATNTVQIHHPASDLMKISLDANPPVAISWPGIPGLTHWRAHFQQGTVQPGSSGSPLFDQNHRIIGQCHGDQNNLGNYCAQQISECGRFDLSWTGGGTNATRLSNWLDPNNSGAMTTNTTNVSSLVPFIGVLSISGSDAVCSTTSQYTLNNNGISAAGNISWVSSNTNIATITASGNPAIVTKIGNGNATITATLSGCDGIQSASKTVVVGLPDNSAFNIYQDPTCNGNRINFGAYTGSVFDNCSLWNIGVTNITWDIITNPAPQIINNSGPGVCANGLNNSGIQAYFSSGTYNNAYIRFKAQNACGWSDWMMRPKPINFSACGSGWSFTITPNPANNSVNVALDGQSVLSDKTLSIREIQITDKIGNVLKQLKYSSGSDRVSFDISNLKQDVYFIRVYNGREWQTQQLSKQ